MSHNMQRWAGHSEEFWPKKNWSKVEGMANHSSIFASGTPWTVWKGRNYKGNKLFPGLEYNSTKLSNLRLNSYREHINIIFLFFFIPLEYLSSFGFICPLLFYDYFYWPKTDAKYQRSLFLVTDWQQQALPFFDFSNPNLSEIYWCS